MQVDDLDLVAALLVEADRRAHQRRDAVELFLAALLVDHLALVVLGVDAVDQHRDRDAVDAAGLGDFGLGGAGNLVIVGFLGLLALVARVPPRRPALLVAGQFVVDGDLAAGRRRSRTDSSRVWLERSTRPSGSNLSEVWVILL